MRCIICRRKTDYITPCGLAECKKHCVVCHAAGLCDFLDQRRIELEARDNKIAELRKAGHTYPEIAQEMDLPKPVIVGVMKKLGLSARAESTQDRDDEIRSLAGTMTHTEIAEKYGLSPVRVGQIIKCGGKKA